MSKIVPNPAVLNARELNRSSAQDDVRLGRAVKSENRAEILDDIDNQHDHKIEKADLTFEAADTENMFAKVSAGVFGGLAALGTFQMGLAMIVSPGIGALLSAAIPAIGAGIIVGGLFAVIGRGIGGLFTEGTKDEAAEHEHLAGKVDLDRQSLIRSSERHGDANIQRGAETQNKITQDYKKLFDQEAA